MLKKSQEQKHSQKWLTHFQMETYPEEISEEPEFGPNDDEPESPFSDFLEMFENFRTSSIFSDIFDDDEDFLAFSAAFGIIFLLFAVVLSRYALAKITKDR